MGCVAGLADGSTLLCGTTGNVCGKRVLKLDPSSNVVWYKDLTTGSTCVYPNSCGEFPNGDIFILSRWTPLLFEIIRLSTDGDVIWAKQYDISGPTVLGSVWAKCSPNGDLIVQLGFSSQHPIVARIDGSGSVIWNNRYPESAIDPTFYPAHVVYVDDEGILTIHSHIWANGGYTSELRVAHLDLDGNVQWSRTYQSPYVPEVEGVVRTSDGSWAMGGVASGGAVGGTGNPYPFMAKIDALGNVQWATAYPGMQWTNTLHVRIIGLPNDELLFSRDAPYDLVHTTATGVPLGSIRFNQPYVGLVDPVIIEASPQWVRLAGEVHYGPPNWSYQRYHFDMAFPLDSPPECQWGSGDPLGYSAITVSSEASTLTPEPALFSISDLAVSVTDLPAELFGDLCDYATGMAPEEPLNDELRIHPTPNDGQWWVDIPDQLQSSGEVVLSVRDVAGRLVLRMRVPSFAQARVDLRGLTDGLYEVELLDGTTRYHGRTVIE